jgi:kinesin family protein 6/9
MELREAKAAYKSCFEALQRAKGEALEAQAKANGLRAALASSFSRWNKGPGPEKTSSVTAAPGPEGDQLDDQEAFDRLEIERVLADDPQSLAFFHAQKTRRAHLTQQGGSLRQVQRNKRLG